MGGRKGRKPEDWNQEKSDPTQEKSQKVKNHRGEPSILSTHLSGWLLYTSYTQNNYVKDKRPKLILKLPPEETEFAIQNPIKITTWDKEREKKKLLRK